LFWWWALFSSGMLWKLIALKLSINACQTIPSSSWVCSNCWCICVVHWCGYPVVVKEQQFSIICSHMLGCARRIKIHKYVSSTAHNVCIGIQILWTFGVILLCSKIYWSQNNHPEFLFLILGEFGHVYKGLWMQKTADGNKILQSQLVAVKTIKGMIPIELSSCIYS